MLFCYMYVLLKSVKSDVLHFYEYVCCPRDTFIRLTAITMTI